MKKLCIIAVAIMAAILFFTSQTHAGEAGSVSIPKVIAIDAEGAGTATDGTGGYKPSRGISSGSLDKDVTLSGNAFTYSASGSPSKTVNDSAVTIFYNGPDTGEEEKSVTATCTVAKLLDISGIIDDTDIFSNFDHYYIGDLSGDFTASDKKDLKLKLKYLPDDLTHDMLPAGWILEGTPAGGGVLTYVKDEAEPKWKGKTPLATESHGVMDYLAKWESMEVKKKLTKFSLKVVLLSNAQTGSDLYVFKDDSRTIKPTYQAKVIPSGLEEMFPDVKFEWQIARGANKIKLEFDKAGKNRKTCTIVPKGYHKTQVSNKEEDVLIKVSWKIPVSGIQIPFHTASMPGHFTVRTPVKIVLDRWVDTNPDQIIPGYKIWQLWYVFYDNLGKKVPGSVISGLPIKEKWIDHVFDVDIYAETGGTKIPPSGEFWDKLGGTVAARQYTGEQQLTCDHIKGKQTVIIDIIKSPPKISASGISAY
jgi:hypothetical protein